MRISFFLYPLTFDDYDLDFEPAKNLIFVKEPVKNSIFNAKGTFTNHVVIDYGKGGGGDAHITEVTK